MIPAKYKVDSEDEKQAQQTAMNLARAFALAYDREKFAEMANDAKEFAEGLRNAREFLANQEK